MRLPLDDQGLRGISGPLIVDGAREQDQVHMLRGELRAGMRVVDIGANIGYYTLLCATLVGPHGHVYAVEPERANVALLGSNIRLNGLDDIVDAYHMGLADFTGEAPLFVGLSANSHTFIRTGTPLTQSVRVEDFETFAANKLPLDFLRLDVEGDEVRVFRGMRAWARQLTTPCGILFEVHRFRYDDSQFNMRAELAYLFDCGFVPKTISGIAGPWRGYTPQLVIKADRGYRGLFSGVAPDDVMEGVCTTGPTGGGIKAVLLVRS
jgi:FkbM family methyltransferase